MTGKAIIATPQVEVDIDDLEFSLSPELDNLHSLELFEEQAVIAFNDIDAAYAQVNDAYTRAAYHIHMLLEHRLWRHRQVPDEMPGVMKQLHPTQEDYLEDLAGRTMRGFAVSTVKGFHTAFRMARQLGYNRQEIEQRGVYIFGEVAKKIDKDYSTGKPLALKDGSPPNGKVLDEYLREVIEEAVNKPDKPDIVLKPSHLKLELERKLAPRTAQISFQRVQGRDMSELRWNYELWDDVGMMTPSRYGTVHISFTADSGDVPPSVMTKFFGKLGINLED